MRRILLLLFLALFIATGCAVLTPSQIAEVRKFAKATEEYSAFPDEVMEAHADLRMNVKLANAASALSGDAALRLFENALRFKKELELKAERAKQACLVLKEYGALLSALATGTHEEELEAAAEKIGGSLDTAIGAYNKIAGSSISPFGGIVAALVRGVSGLYIKHQQTIAVREAVFRGDAAVKAMADAISGLLGLYTALDPTTSLALIQAEKKQLLEWYELVGYKDPLSTTMIVAEEVEKADLAEELAKTAKMSIDNLVEAHTELAEKLKSKKSLPEVIGTVKVFVNEVKAAKSVYDKLSKK